MSSASPEKQALASQRWRKNNPIASLLKNAKHRARVNHLDFDLRVEDIEKPEYCPVLGLRLVYPGEGAGRGDANASLDRINPALGYIKGNVAIISWRANKLKSNASLEELKALVAFMEKQNGRSEFIPE